MIRTAILLASLLSVGSNPVETAEDLEARWRREYPSAAEELEAISREFEAKGRFSYRWNNGETIINKELTVASSGDKRLFVRDQSSSESPKFQDRPELTVAYCETPEIAFKLTKNPTSTEYIIAYIQKYSEDPESDFNYWYAMFARNSTVYFGASFLQRMGHPSFVLKSIEAVEKSGDQLVRIGYAYEGKYVLEDGAVDLDPAKNWAIRSVDVNCENKKKNWPPIALKIKVNYTPVDGTRYFPARMESFCQTPKLEVYTHAILELDQITLGKVPDDLFRLTHFGLPEVPLRPAPRDSVFTFRNPLFWVALAATLVCFSSLWFLRSRQNRTT